MSNRSASFTCAAARSNLPSRCTRPPDTGQPGRTWGRPTRSRSPAHRRGSRPPSRQGIGPPVACRVRRTSPVCGSSSVPLGSRDTFHNAVSGRCRYFVAEVFERQLAAGQQAKLFTRSVIQLPLRSVKATGTAHVCVGSRQNPMRNVGVEDPPPVQCIDAGRPLSRRASSALRCFAHFLVTPVAIASMSSAFIGRRSPYSRTTSDDLPRSAYSILGCARCSTKTIGSRRPAHCLPAQSLIPRRSLRTSGRGS